MAIRVFDDNPRFVTSKVARYTLAHEKTWLTPALGRIRLASVYRQGEVVEKRRCHGEDKNTNEALEWTGNMPRHARFGLISPQEGKE